MTTPAEKDAMALAAIDAAEIRCGHELAAAVAEARAHLAARIDQQAGTIDGLKDIIRDHEARATRAEADLAAVLAFLRDDATAISYQSLGQYRKAALDAARGAG